MKKIPTLFVRDPATRLVTPEVAPWCGWVAAGEGTATAKWDGTAVGYLDGRWWVRRAVRPGRPAPAGFLPADRGPGGVVYGWEPAAQSGYREPLEEAVRRLPAEAPDRSTWELVGPKVNGNPGRDRGHWLMRHGAHRIEDVPRGYDGLAAYLPGLPFEGIVWHHRDGRAAKVKRQDFGLPWPRPRDPR